jgi:hypothetical protein
MKSSLSYSVRITKYVYDVVYEDDNYTVEVYIDDTDEMVEDNVFDEHGHLLGYEGNEGELRDNLLAHVLKEHH